MSDRTSAHPPVNSLAARLLAESFTVTDGILGLGGVRADDLAARFGTPLFVYDAEIMRRRYRELSACVAGFATVYYSVKANPAPAIARLFVAEGAGLEVASGAEFLTARRAGCPAERILFAGPGKSSAELELALAQGCGEIHLESFEEVARLGAAARRLGLTADVAIRINPAAGASGGAMRMGGKPAAFGFDEEVLADVLAAVARAEALQLTGVHVFSGTQILDAKVLLAQWAHGIGLAADIARQTGRPLRRIDLGGGLGIPYHDGDQSLDPADLRAGLAPLVDRLRSDPMLRSAEVVLEPGRYLTGPAGVYIVGVNAVKTSRGQRFVVCDGGMHHHLAASGNLGQVIKRDYPLLAATALHAPSRSPATVVGPLCTPLDTFGRAAELPPLEAGDLIAVLQSGAYGLTASPVGFLGHPTPAEVLVDSGMATLIRPRGTFEMPIASPYPA